MAGFVLQNVQKHQNMAHIAPVMAHRCISDYPQKSILLSVITFLWALFLSRFLDFSASFLVFLLLFRPCQLLLFPILPSFLSHFYFFFCCASCFFGSLAFCSSCHLCDVRMESILLDILYPILLGQCGFKDFA